MKFINWIKSNPEGAAYMLLWGLLSVGIMVSAIVGGLTLIR